MGGVLRVIAFGIGLALGVGVLLAMNFAVRGVWLPVAFSGLCAALMYSQDWLTKRKLAGTISLTLGLGVCGGWLASSDLTSSHTIPTGSGSVLQGLSILAMAVLIIRTATMPPKLRSAAIWVVVLVILAWMVSVGSSSSGSASRMEDVLVRRFHMTLAQAHEIVPVFRKLFHFCFYGFGASVAWRGAAAGDAPRRQRWLFSLLFVLLMATFDEARQATVPDRGSSPFDVMIDMAGAATFVALAEWGFARRASLPSRKS